MLKILKYLKKSYKSILLIIILLIVQATCDLSLPDYTSKIINVGISQNGIEESVYKVISDEKMKDLLLFTTQDEKILSCYTLKDNVNATKEEIKKYPYLKNNKLYISNSNCKEEELFELTKESMLILTLLTTNSDQIKEIENEIKNNLPSNMKNLPLMDIIKLMSDVQREALLKNFSSKFDGLDNTLLKQISITGIKEEYKNIGVNLEKLQTNYIVIAGAKMLGIALLSAVATITVGLFGARVAASLSFSLRNDVFKKVLNLSATEVKEFTSSSLITRTTNDINQIQMMMLFMLRSLFYAPIMGLGGVIKIFNINSEMSWILAVAILSIVSLLMLMFVLVLPKFKIIQNLIDRLNQVTREIITGIPVIRAFRTEKHEENRFKKASFNLKKTSLFVNSALSILMPTMFFIMNTVCVLIVYKSAGAIDVGTMQVGDMLAFIQYTMQVIMSFLMISMFSISFPRASVSAKRIKEVLESESSIKEIGNPKTYSKRIEGTIEFRNVTFRYPDSDEDLLKDISFKIEQGQTVAFIGSTGSGKSTLINLIPRIYDATEGEILVNGINVKDVSLNDLRKKISFSTQKGILFGDTIKNNISYPLTNSNLEEVKKAAAIAQADSFVEKKDNKYNDIVSQGATNLSGGQKQRLSIARSIFKQSDIYIFDDSFSALDYKTDLSLRTALKKELTKATVLIVAQRINTIINADKIIVIDEGKIVGTGTHKELLNSCNIYKEIAYSQLTKEELEHDGSK